ncbi:ABC transporter permease [Paenibacillus sp. PR3]|uniref:ABC transporter permease n=1 Tax=Paenibacillus terricola TaxID=2763503 RepID=A0ABR8MWU2_9BACL|nr:ABC transporter permease [Paenibacillus terricola]MBD3919004.1 ABC transporter permease [Paenibacillus terricola]
MVRLVCFEWRKHFLKRSIIIAMLLFSVLNIAKVYSIHEESSLLANPGWKDLYWKEWADFGGAITNKRIEKLMNIYLPLEQLTADHTASTKYRTPDTYLSNVYEDWNFFRLNYVDPMKYAYDYKAYAQGVVSAAKENIAFYESVDNSYERNKNAVIAKLFEGRSITSFAYTEMYQYYVQYDFSGLLVLLICLYGLMSVFLHEKVTEMDILLLTSKAGGKATIWAKLIASALFVSSVSFWFWVVDFVSFSIIFDSWDAASSPLFMLVDFIHAALNVSLWQYAILSALIKTAGILVFALAFLFMSILFRNALIPFIISLFISFISIYFEEVTMGSGRIWIKVINPFVLLFNRELFRKIEFVSLVGFPLPSYIAALLLATAWGALLLGGILIVVRKNTLWKGGGNRVHLEV